MRVNPITPIYHPRNPPRQKRALMAVNYDKHTVIDAMTGERTELPAKQAWQLYERLNA